MLEGNLDILQGHASRYLSARGLFGMPLGQNCRALYTGQHPTCNQQLAVVRLFLREQEPCCLILDDCVLSNVHAREVSEVVYDLSQTALISAKLLDPMVGSLLP